VAGAGDVRALSAVTAGTRGGVASPAAPAVQAPLTLTAGVGVTVRRRGTSVTAALERLYDDMAASTTVQPDAILLNTLVSAAPDAGRALAVYRSFGRYRLAPDRWTFNALVAVAARDLSAPLSVAFAVRNEMRKAGSPPDAFTYSALVDACAQRGDTAAAFTVVAEMRAAGVEPNAHTMSSLVFACGSAGDVVRARQVLNSMRPAQRSVHAYTAVVDAAAKRGRLDVAFDVFTDMHAVGIAANAHTYSTLIDGCCKARAFVAVADVFGRMRAAGLTPDVTSYTSLLKALADGFPSSILLPPSGAAPATGGPASGTGVGGKPSPGVVEGAAGTATGGAPAEPSSAAAARPAPTVVAPSSPAAPSLKTRSDAAAATSTNDDTDASFASAPPASGTPPSAATFGSTAGHRNAVRAVGEDRLLRVFLCFADMRAAGVEPDRVTYNVLLNACAVARAGPERAMAIFDAMVAEGISPDVISYTSLIKAICASAPTAGGGAGTGAGVSPPPPPPVAVAAAEAGPPPAAAPSTLGLPATPPAEPATPGPLDLALGVLADMRLAGVAPGELAYAALVEALADAGRLDDAAGLFDAMNRLAGGERGGAAAAATAGGNSGRGAAPAPAASGSISVAAAAASGGGTLPPPPPPSLAVATAAVALLRAATAAADRLTAGRVAEAMARRGVEAPPAVGRAYASLAGLPYVDAEAEEGGGAGGGGGGGGGGGRRGRPPAAALGRGA